MVPLHVCTFIGVSGNGVEVAEDMARRLLESHFDAREKMEQRQAREKAEAELEAKKAAEREAVWHSQCMIPVLWIGCPPREGI
jgi:hypothetical protein